MTRYVYSGLASKFVLTELGFEKAHIRSKYEAGYKRRSYYEKCVPVSWVEKGFVKEVPLDVQVQS